MTTDEIKKIAEESAQKTLDAWKENKAIGLKKLITDGCINAIDAISDHYFIVDKSKVRKEYEGYIYMSENHPKASERNKAKCVAVGIKFLFGADAFKEE